MNRVSKWTLVAVGAVSVGTLLAAIGLCLAALEWHLGFFLVAAGILAISLGAVAHIYRDDRRAKASDAAAKRMERRVSAIAGTVGRSAPIIRETSALAKASVDTAKRNEHLLKQRAQPVSASDRRVNVPRVIEAPTGYQASTVEVAEVQNRVNRSTRDVTVAATQRAIRAQGDATLVDVPKGGLTVDFDVANLRHTSIQVVCRGETSRATKIGLLWVKAFNAAGAEMSAPILPSESKEYGCYAYLHDREGQAQTVPLKIPAAAHRITVGIVPWNGDIIIKNEIRLVGRGIRPGWEEERFARDIRVAMILDEFSYNSFRYECTPVVLDPKNWLEQMEEHRPDLFLCESAWSGADSENRPWQGQVYTSTNFARENRTELLKILEYCRSMNIPTVFWNKEDPSHYDDKVHNFVDTAVRFDHIFTTDERMVDRYRLEYGHKSVHCLPFAVQPRLFNPIETQTRSEDVVFAGGWYSNHRQRSLDMERMFDAALATGRTVKIYDRFFGQADPKHEYPSKYQSYLNRPVPHSQVAAVYKESTIGMTINTETQSGTMFARRIFELMACNTLVVSNHSVGVERFFGENVIFLDKDPEALSRLTLQEMDRIRAQNLDLVLREHTYERRFATILDVAGIARATPDAEPALIFRVNELADVPQAHKELIIKGAHAPARVLMVGRGISPLDAVDVLVRYQDSGVRIVDERIACSPHFNLHELCGGASTIVFADYGNSLPEHDWIDSARVHLDYAGAPVVSAGESASRFTFTRIPCGTPALLTVAQLPSILENSASDSVAVAYQI